jgi:hypothetical protein
LPPLTPVTLGATSKRCYVSNILGVLESATPDQVKRGQAWYPLARELAAGMHCDLSKAAGVIAALSPQTSWDVNLRMARSACLGQPVRGMRDKVVKVRRILEGEDPLEVLPVGRKTHDFYRAIIDPDDPLCVVIDRHAHDVARGVRFGNTDRGLSSPSRYSLFQGLYRTAAARALLTPNQIQAITWVVWKERTLT